MFKAFEKTRNWLIGRWRPNGIVMGTEYGMLTVNGKLKDYFSNIREAKIKMADILRDAVIFFVACIFIINRSFSANLVFGYIMLFLTPCTVSLLLLRTYWEVKNEVGELIIKRKKGKNLVFSIQGEDKLVFYREEIEKNLEKNKKKYIKNVKYVLAIIGGVCAIANTIINFISFFWDRDLS